MSAGDVPHLPRSAPVEAYGNGGFRFAGMSHRGSLLCLPDAIYAWTAAAPDEIDRASLRLVFENASEIDTLLIGSGRDIVPIAPELREMLRRASVGVDVMQTGAAIRTYNIMIGERRRVAAALIAVS